VSGGAESALPSKVTRWLACDDVIVHVQPGAGGFGDPLERAPERVAADVWNGKISAAYARAQHAVVVDPASGRLDAPATRELRARRHGGATV